MTTWLNAWSVEAVSEVLAAHGVRDGAVVLQGVPQSNPRFATGHAIVGGWLAAKFALSEVPARGIAYETWILRLLHRRLPVPEVVVASSDPVFLATRLVAGEPLDDGAGAAPDLARFLAALHDPAFAALVGDVAPFAAGPQATTDALRARLSALVRGDQKGLVGHWCDWVDSAPSNATSPARSSTCFAARPLTPTSPRSDSATKSQPATGPQT